jgi:hypothetical protein
MFLYRFTAFRIVEAPSLFSDRGVTGNVTVTPHNVGAGCRANTSAISPREITNLPTSGCSGTSCSVTLGREPFQ